MGGPVPLGYDLEARKLIPHPTEAELVRNIFALYLKLGCVLKLMAHLNRENVKTKTWVTKKGIRVELSPLHVATSITCYGIAFIRRNSAPRTLVQERTQASCRELWARFRLN